MAEAIALACGVAQFVGFAGQLAEGVHYVRAKIKSVKGAPKLVKRLREEMQLLESTLRRLEAVEKHIQPGTKVHYESLLQDCSRHVDDLDAILSKFDFPNDEQKLKRLWKAIAVSDRRSDMEDILKGLERSEGALTLFLTGLNLEATGSLQSTLTDHVATVEPSLQRIETSISHVSNVSADILLKTTQIDDSIKEAYTKMMGRLDQSAQQMEASISRIVEETVQQLMRSGGKDQSQLPVSAGAQSQASSRNRVNVGEPFQDQVQVQRQLSRSRSSFGLHLIPRKQVYGKTIPLPFGFLQTKITRAIVRSNSEHTDERAEETLQLQITFVPFWWWSSRGHQVMIDKIASHTNFISFKTSIRTYNIIPKDATIWKACRNRDLQTIQSLFKYRDASPFDVDHEGQSLMSAVYTPRDAMLCNEQSLRSAMEVMTYLITEGADSGTVVRQFFSAYSEFAHDYYLFDGNNSLVSFTDRLHARLLNEMLQLLLKHTQIDPFADNRVLLDLWDNSLGGKAVPPLSSAYLFQEGLTGLESLVFESPDRIFHDLLSKSGAVSEEMWQFLMDERYETLAYLCQGGKDSIMRRIFSSPVSKSASRLANGDSCFCPTNGSHLLFKALHGSECKFMSNRAPLRNHVRRILVLILENGEDPNARCSCKTAWQWSKGGRSITDLAAEEGLIDVWTSVLEEFGFEAMRILDEWRYEGVQRLFEEVDESSGLVVPLRFVGSLLYTTISSIV